MTLAEYFAFEEKAEWKHEFHPVAPVPPGEDLQTLRGDVFAMSGASYAHILITRNLSTSLHARTRGGPCTTLMNDMRVATDPQGRFFYPDATIVCAEPAFHPAYRVPSTLVNPRVLFEVLSDSTETYDRTTKFDHYRNIKTLEEYVLVAQHRPRVESFLRMEDGAWALQTYQGVESELILRSISLTLPLTEIYVGVRFDPADDPDAMPIDR